MSKYSVIVDCPDSYLDILKVFFIFAEKNWKDREATIYVTTQKMEIDHPSNVVFIKCGEEFNSIQRAKKALSIVKEDYALILNSDDFFTRKVDNNELNNLIDYAIEKDIKYIRVWRTINKEHRMYKTDYKGLYFCNKKARYSKSLMANFWKKDEFLRVFDEDNNDGWTIEAEWLRLNHTEEKGFYENYCYYDLDPFHILHAVTKGCWIRSAYRKMAKLGVSKELLSERKKLPIKTTIKTNIGLFFDNHFSSSFCYKLKKLTGKVFKFVSDS